VSLYKNCGTHFPELVNATIIIYNTAALWWLLPPYEISSKVKIAYEAQRNLLEGQALPQHHEQVLAK
jgi:hypothetical protein